MVLADRASATPNTLAETVPSMSWPPAAQRVFDRAFARERDARFESGSQFARELNEALTYERPTAMPSEKVIVESGAGEAMAPTVAIANPKILGTVKSYSIDARKGLVRRENGVEHRVHQANIIGPGLKILASGERIEFEAGPGGHDAEAKRIKRLDGRIYGSVVQFDPDLGWGRVVPDGESRRLFLHWKDVLVGARGGVVSPEEGERVEFEAIATPKGDKAIRVIRLDPRSPLSRFADMVDIDAHLETLANSLAQPENWNYRDEASKDPFPILRSYIYFTFPRLLDEGKIAEQRDARGRPVACFNTGLVTRLQEEIFAYFEGAPPTKSRDPNHEFAPPPRWTFQGFLKRDDRRLSHFPTPPTIANYFTNPADLLYDLSVELVPDWEHILLRKKRFPKSMQEMDELRQKRLITQTIDDAKNRVRRNYKTAIPQFYRGSLQLLLPLCLERQDRADLALVVVRDHQVYRATTVLTLDWAIRNARLIARPDREWLDP